MIQYKGVKCIIQGLQGTTQGVEGTIQGFINVAVTVAVTAITAQ